MASMDRSKDASEETGKRSGSTVASADMYIETLPSRFNRYPVRKHRKTVKFSLRNNQEMDKLLVVVPRNVTPNQTLSFNCPDGSEVSFFPLQELQHFRSDAFYLILDLVTARKRASIAAREGAKHRKDGDCDIAFLSRDALKHGEYISAKLNVQPFEKDNQKGVLQNRDLKKITSKPYKQGKKRLNDKSTTKENSKEVFKVQVKKAKQWISEDYRVEEEILFQLPDEVCCKFRKVGFAKWQGDWLPVLFIGPNDVASEAVRHEWMKFFLQYVKDLRPMMQLVVWYGFHGKNEQYGFVEDALTYDEAVKRKCHVLPHRIQSKLAKGKELTTKEQKIVDGFEELETARKLPEADRWEWKTPRVVFI